MRVMVNPFNAATAICRRRGGNHHAHFHRQLSTTPPSSWPRRALIDSVSMHANKQQSATAEFKVEVFIRHASLKNNSDVRGKSNLTFICMSNRPTSLTKPSQTRLLCSNNCDETHTIHYHHARQCPWSSSLACEAKALVFIVRGNDRLHYFARQ